MRRLILKEIQNLNVFFSKHNSLHTYMDMYSISTESHMPRDGGILIYDLYRYYHFSSKESVNVNKFIDETTKKKKRSKLDKRISKMGGPGSGRTGARTSRDGRDLRSYVLISTESHVLRDSEFFVL